MTHYDEDADLVKILYGNIQSNERLRNNLFALYMVIVAALFGFQGQTFPKVDSALVSTFLSLLVWLAGVLFLGAFIRYKEMIKRDVALAFPIQEKLFQKYPDLHTLFREHWGKINAKHRLVSSVSTALIVLTLIISVAALAIVLLPLFECSSPVPAYSIPVLISIFVNMAAFVAYGGSPASFNDRVTSLS